MNIYTFLILIIFTKYSCIYDRSAIGHLTIDNNIHFGSPIAKYNHRLYAASVDDDGKIVQINKTTNDVVREFSKSETGTKFAKYFGSDGTAHFYALTEKPGNSISYWSDNEDKFVDISHATNGLVLSDRLIYHGNKLFHAAIIETSKDAQILQYDLSTHIYSKSHILTFNNSPIKSMPTIFLVSSLQHFEHTAMIVQIQTESIKCGELYLFQYHENTLKTGYKYNSNADSNNMGFGSQIIPIKIGNLNDNPKTMVVINHAQHPCDNEKSGFMLFHATPNKTNLSKLTLFDGPKSQKIGQFLHNIGDINNNGQEDIASITGNDDTKYLIIHMQIAGKFAATNIYTYIKSLFNKDGASILGDFIIPYCYANNNDCLFKNLFISGKKAVFFLKVTSTVDITFTSAAINIEYPKDDIDQDGSIYTRSVHIINYSYVSNVADNTPIRFRVKVENNYGSVYISKTTTFASTTQLTFDKKLILLSEKTITIYIFTKYFKGETSPSLVASVDSTDNVRCLKWNQFPINVTFKNEVYTDANLDFSINVESVTKIASPFESYIVKFKLSGFSKYISLDRIMINFLKHENVDIINLLEVIPGLRTERIPDGKTSKDRASFEILVSTSHSIQSLQIQTTLTAFLEITPQSSTILSKTLNVGSTRAVNRNLPASDTADLRGKITFLESGLPTSSGKSFFALQFTIGTETNKESIIFLNIYLPSVIDKNIVSIYFKELEPTDTYKNCNNMFPDEFSNLKESPSISSNNISFSNYHYQNYKCVIDLSSTTNSVTFKVRGSINVGNKLIGTAETPINSILDLYSPNIDVKISNSPIIFSHNTNSNSKIPVILDNPADSGNDRGDVDSEVEGDNTVDEHGDENADGDQNEDEHGDENADGDQNEDEHGDNNPQEEKNKDEDGDKNAEYTDVLNLSYGNQNDIKQGDDNTEEYPTKNKTSTNNGDIDGKVSETLPSKSNNTVIVSVSVSVVIAILIAGGVIGFIVYRRHQESSSSEI